MESAIAAASKESSPDSPQKSKIDGVNKSFTQAGRIENKLNGQASEEE